MASMPESTSSKFTVSVDELRDVLECPVCLKVPRQPPVYQCDRGHCFCSACHSKLSNCPVCRTPLGKTRSLIFEKVLSKMPQTCRFSDFGCKVEHTKSHLESHEKDCPYRVVCCVDLACQQQVCMADLMNHMVKDHEREDFVHTESNSYRSHFIVQCSDFTREIMWISDHIVLDDRHFFRECCRSKEGQWFVWVYMIGSRKECEDYIYTVKIISDDREEELVYKGRCMPLDVSKEKLVDAGNCLIFPDSTAKRFWANQRIHYQVYVLKRKAPKKLDKEGARSSSKHLSAKSEGEAADANGAEDKKATEDSSKEDEPVSSTSPDTSCSSQKSKNKQAKQPENQRKRGESEVQPTANAPPAEDERETSC